MNRWNAGFSRDLVAVVSRFGTRGPRANAFRRDYGRDEMPITGEFQNEIGAAPFNIFLRRTIVLPMVWIDW
jgi:hypothetical protein